MKLETTRSLYSYQNQPPRRSTPTQDRLITYNPTSTSSADRANPPSPHSNNQGQSEAHNQHTQPTTKPPAAPSLPIPSDPIPHLTSQPGLQLAVSKACPCPCPPSPCLLAPAPGLPCPAMRVSPLRFPPPPCHRIHPTREAPPSPLQPPDPKGPNHHHTQDIIMLLRQIYCVCTEYTVQSMDHLIYVMAQLAGGW